MSPSTDNQRSAMQLLEQMFKVEMSFLGSDSADVEMLATAFHPDVVIHEPASLPYAGDWREFKGVGALFQRMRETWSEFKVENLEAVRSGDTVYMTCMLHMTARRSGATVTQPFAEILRFKSDLLIDGTPFYYDTSEIGAVLSG